MSTSDGGRILLVEDESLVRGMIGALLEANGFTVEPVRGVDEAMAALAKPDHGFDLVLTDVRLTGPRTGIELADWICEHVRGVRVVLMSALSEGSLSGHQFVQKPFTERELLASLEAAAAPAV
jgi:DNA-binding response OmpR family regulator